MNPVAAFALLITLLAIERIEELIVSKRNIRRLISYGGSEFGAKHYPVIIAVHLAFFLSLIIEFYLRNEPLAPYWPVPFSIFILAQALRFWVRKKMGNRWTSRVIVVPGERFIASGPFRFFKHPVYIAVALELFSLPLIFGLFFTSGLFSFLNAIVLIAIRIPTERAALDWSQGLESK